MGQRKDLGIKRALALTINPPLEKGIMVCAILFLSSEVGQTEACQPKVWPTTTEPLALPGHGDCKLTTFVPSVDDGPQSCGNNRS